MVLVSIEYENNGYYLSAIFVFKALNLPQYSK